MNIIWLGHGSFRIEIEDQVLLIDPWLKDNPMLDDAHHADAIKGAKFYSREREINDLIGSASRFAETGFQMTRCGS